MLRTLFIALALLVGWSYAFQSALYAACLYLWIAYFRPESWVWNPIFASLNLSYLAGVYLIIRTIVSGTKIRFTFRNSLLIVFLAHSLLSTAQGIDYGYSYPYLELFATTIVVSFLLTVVIQTPADLRLILIVIALSLGFEAAKQGWAQLILNPGARNDNTIPFLGDNNLVAVGMAMLLPILTALAATSQGWRKRGLQFLSIGVVYRGISTYSRGGLLAFGAVGVLQLIRSPHRLRAIAAATIVVAIVVPALPQQYWDRMNTITAPADEDDARDVSQQGRLHFWQVAVQIANDRPLLGVGHSAYSRAYNDYDTTGGQFGVDRAVHSAWFGVLAELGYTGFFLFVVIIVTSLLACRRVRNSARRGEIPVEMAAYATGLEAALVAFIVGGSFVSFHYCEMLWHFFALTMALETVALREAALARATAPAPAAAAAEVAAVPSTEREPEFVWG
jgi:probable O-glycosylation ligase (exosortase A-associated)